MYISVSVLLVPNCSESKLSIFCLLDFEILGNIGAEIKLTISSVRANLYLLSSLPEGAFSLIRNYTLFLQSYDGTTHFESTVTDVIAMYSKITGKVNF